MIRRMAFSVVNNLPTGTSLDGQQRSPLHSGRVTLNPTAVCFANNHLVLTDESRKCRLLLVLTDGSFVHFSVPVSHGRFPFLYPPKISMQAKTILGMRTISSVTPNTWTYCRFLVQKLLLPVGFIWGCSLFNLINGGHLVKQSPAKVTE